MAKPVKKKPKTEQISIAKIYETLQSREFLQELWWDLISDMKDKPTYKRLKIMVNSLIGDTLEDFSSEMADEAERLKRRTALTEISIMTYTVDTVITEVLYRKLQNEFLQLITNIVEEVKHERRYVRNCKTDNSSKSENIQSTLINEEENEDSNNATSSSSKGINTEQILTESTSDLNVNPISNETERLTPAKRGRPRKVVAESTISEEDGLLSESTPKRKRGRPRKVVRDPEPLEEEIPKGNGVYDVPRYPLHDDSDAEESDTESTISVGHISIDTVSSVHTSELSSFEDTISICSGDEENGKRKSHIPLKIANDMYLSGKLSEIYRIGKEAEKIKIKASTPILKDKEKKKESSSVNVNSSRPQRVRKPNSKYNSETMFCEVKDYSTPQFDSSPHEEQNAAHIKSPQRQKRRKTTSSDEGKSETTLSSPARNSTSISLGKNSPNHCTPVLATPKSTSKRYSSSDLYKPRPVIGNAFQSRGTTAVTLFST